MAGRSKQVAKVLKLALGVCFVLLILLSLQVLAVHAGHTCLNQHCEFCAQVGGVYALKQLVLSVWASFVLAVVLLYRWLENCIALPRAAATPCNLKTRLIN